jgi:hypothetical protein
MSCECVGHCIRSNTQLLLHPSADKSKFAIGLRVCVQNGAPAKLKVKCSISKTITDEPERSEDSQPQAARRPRERGKSRARWTTPGR